MRAWRVHEFGHPADVLVLEDVAAPTRQTLAGLRMSMGGWLPAGTPGTAPNTHDDWVIVDVTMAALALPDVTMANGAYPVPVPRPYISGQEGVGIVTDAGPGNEHLIGKRVGACMIQPFGSLAEVSVGVGMIVEISDSMSDADAAALLIPAHTGYHAVIRRGAVAAGEIVAVRGASGGLGSACVQLARASGAEVIAIISGTDAVDKAAHCRSIGAAHIVDTSRVAPGQDDASHPDTATRLRELTGGRGVDVIIDPVQGPDAGAVRAGLRVGGRHVLCGHAGGLPSIDPDFYLRNHTLVGVTLGGYPPAEMQRMHVETQAAIDDLIARGLYRATPTEVIDFADVPDALTRLAARQTMGRVVVRC
ncbi:MAG: alcohol dehydrogenase [Acidimicrobiales bacterium]|nr:alcohol dehydrogenase [Acidimicrobiales bacterium]